MFKVRLISGILVLAAMVLFVVTGGELLFAAMGVISIIGMTELYRIYKVEKALAGFLGYLACIIYYSLIYTQNQEYFVMLFIGFLMMLMGIYVIGFPKYTTEQVTAVFFGLFYVSVMLSYIYQVRMLEDGAWIVWLIFIGAWGSDTCAYCVGMLFGKHKAFPKLSPKKSVEGCIGGIVGAALLGLLYGVFTKNFLVSIENPEFIFAIIGAASSVISQIGDLAASAIKRNHDIKDYSNLIPGHGGILDRFDSIIFTAPIVYYLASML